MVGYIAYTEHPLRQTHVAPKISLEIACEWCAKSHEKEGSRYIQPKIHELTDTRTVKARDPRSRPFSGSTDNRFSYVCAEIDAFTFMFLVGCKSSKRLTERRKGLHQRHGTASRPTILGRGFLSGMITSPILALHNILPIILWAE